MKNKILILALVAFVLFGCKKDEAKDEIHFIQVKAKYETNNTNVKGNILLFDINSVSTITNYSIIYANSGTKGEIFALDIGGGTATAIFPTYSKEFTGVSSIFSKDDFSESFPHKYFVVIFINDFGYRRASGKIINYDGNDIKLEKTFSDPLSSIPLLFPTQYEQWQ